MNIKIKWKLKGLILNTEKYNLNYSQLPVAIDLGNFYRIFFSNRNNFSNSLPLYLDLEKKTKKILYVKKKPLLDLGAPGSFDESGVMPTSIFKFKNKYYLYYIGWTKRITVPYVNNIGLAISSDCKSFTKYSEGPIFFQNHKEPYPTGTLNIYKRENYLYGFYLYNRGWVQDKTTKNYEPTYNINIAKSLNGIEWKRDGKIAINFKNKLEGGICSASVIKINNNYLMWYCYRNKFNYRNSKKNAYKIGYAFSKDLMNWNRLDNQNVVQSSNSDWDSIMTAYPNVLKLNKSNLIMFYNGNNFGKQGIAMAEGSIL